MVKKHTWIIRPRWSKLVKQTRAHESPSPFVWLEYNMKELGSAKEKNVTVVVEWRLFL